MKRAWQMLPSAATAAIILDAFAPGASALTLAQCLGSFGFDAGADQEGKPAPPASMMANSSSNPSKELLLWNGWPADWSVGWKLTCCHC